MLVIAGLLVLGLFSLNQLSKSRCFQLVGTITCRVATEEPLVALTFDDGPTRIGVEAVLPVLAEYDAKATFFLIGHHMERRPELAPQLLKAGHELGNHTYSHEHNVGRSLEFYRGEIRQTKTLLEQAGAQTTLFRPPYGRKLIGLPYEADRAGYHTIMWDVADRAGSTASPEGYANDILNRVRPGSIILMHPMTSGNKTAREALPLILEGLEKRGLKPVTVSALLASKRHAN